ncbi:MAG: hypothetical protein M1828_004570 [Chrysothrix sp. TS-e1954]|nr:MAG: hypothetical protein M1828_004570 [Chrysothrix sp. TS-e1954]
MPSKEEKASEKQYMSGMTKQEKKEVRSDQRKFRHKSTQVNDYLAEREKKARKAIMEETKRMLTEAENGMKELNKPIEKYRPIYKKGIKEVEKLRREQEKLQQRINKLQEKQGASLERREQEKLQQQINKLQEKQEASLEKQKRAEADVKDKLSKRIEADKQDRMYPGEEVGGM